MKKITILVSLLVLVFGLSSCAAKPFVPPEGARFVEKSSLQFFINEEAEDPEEYWYFDFDEKYYFFEGPYFNNINFTAINNYKDISDEFHRFLASASHVYKNSALGDYDDKIKLSLKATETSYNNITIKVDEIYDVDAILTTDNGLQIYFLYSTFTKDGDIIIIPSTIFAFYFTVLEVDTLTFIPSQNGSASLIQYNINEHIVPVMPKSKVDNQIEQINPLFSNYESFTLVEEHDYIEETTISQCEDETLPNCFTKMTYSLTGIIDDEFTLDDVLDFYSLFDITPLFDYYTFTNNGINYKIVFNETAEGLYFTIDLL